MTHGTRSSRVIWHPNPLVTSMGHPYPSCERTLGLGG